MYRSIAQLVALTCHGNAYLFGRHGKPFFPLNSTCAVCDSISFVVMDESSLASSPEKVVAKNPDEWFSFLKSHGAEGIRLSYLPQNNPGISDHMLSAFVGGGGKWEIEVLYPKNRSEFWMSRWKVWNESAPDNRIWRVTYGRVSEKRTLQVEDIALTAIANDLEKAINEAYSFGRQNKFEWFSKCFEEALDTLSTKGKILHGQHKDLVTEWASLDMARMILDAAQSAWVFGGMLSWNDHGFEGSELKEYERVSEQLFVALNNAIMAASNASLIMEHKI